MPELPDITLYIDAIRAFVGGALLERISIRSPFLLRTVEPPPEQFEQRTLLGVERLGKRIALHFGDDLYLVLHLMIAGRLLWKPAGASATGKIDLAAFRFASDTLVLTEASQKKRASLHTAAGPAALASHQPGGLDVFASTPEQFRAALSKENRTLKRALTSPRLIDGIGNAYSDEILHRARLSPIRLTGAMADDEFERLHAAAVVTLNESTARLRTQFGFDPATGAPGPRAKFPGPGQITAFRPEFAVHGKFGEACPICGTNVARIVHAENETNYCPGCQTGGKLLADRSLSRLLKSDWPRTAEAWEDDCQP